MAAAIWAFVISNPLLSRAGHAGGSDPRCPRSLLLREQVDVRVNSAPAQGIGSFVRGRPSRVRRPVTSGAKAVACYARRWGKQVFWPPRVCAALVLHSPGKKRREIRVLRA